MKTKLLTIATVVVLMLTAMTKGLAQNAVTPCLPQMHGLEDHQSAMCGFTQSIALTTGANWVSFNVETDLDDLKLALMEAQPGTAITIQGQNSNANYNPNNNRWSGQLRALDLTNMYKISVASNSEIVFEGMPVDPSTHPVTIKNGANWIAFPLSESMTVANAFAGFAQNGDKVQAQTNNASYKNGRWSGQLRDLEPGKGYVYQSAQSGTRTFTFPTPTSKSAQKKNKDKIILQIVEDHTL